MKKVMVTIVFALFIQSTHASLITPSIRRDQKDLQRTPIATSWSQRKAIGFSNSSSDWGHANRSISTPYAMYAYKDISLQAYKASYSTEYNEDLPTNEDDNINVTAGYRITPNTAIGVAKNVFKDQTKTNYSNELETQDTTSLSFSKRTNEDFYYGVGVKYLKYESNYQRLPSEYFSGYISQDTYKSKAYFLGFGKINENKNLSAQFYVQKQEQYGPYFEASLTYVGKSFDIDSSISHRTYEYSDSVTTYYIDMDVSLSESFYIVPAFNYSKSTKGSQSFGIGYRTNKFDIELKATRYSSSSNSLLNLAYFL